MEVSQVKIVHKIFAKDVVIVTVLKQKMVVYVYPLNPKIFYPLLGTANAIKVVLVTTVSMILIHAS
jgi:hypothetical protein